jgi:3-oxoadipate enol-lactonase
VSAPVPVHFVDEGPPNAPAVVLSGSLGSTLAMWDPQVPALSERFRVIRYDHRGHGGSPMPPGPYDIASLAGDVLAVLDRLEVTRAHLCGLSLGGQVVMWIASHAPDRVDRLVLCCTSAWFGPPEPWIERAETVRAHGTGAVARAVAGRWFTPGFAAANPAIVERTRAMIAATPPEGYAACCEAVGRTDLRGDLGAIRAPTLVVGGAQDPGVPSERIEALSNGIAGSRVTLVDPAAHLANVEQAEQVTGLILDHLGESLSSPPLSPEARSE